MIDEMHHHIAGQNQEIDHLQQLLNEAERENRDLRETIETQRQQLAESDIAAANEYENIRQYEVKVQELEELVQHQNEQAQTRLHQLESLIEENTQLSRKIQDQKGISNDIMDDMLDSLSRIRNKQAPKLEEIIKVVQSKETKMIDESKRMSSEVTETPEEITAQPNSNAMEIEEKGRKLSPEIKRRVITKAKKTYDPKSSNDTFQTSSNETKSKEQVRGTSMEPFTIPWKGKILTPTPSQLRQYSGDLNEIAKNIGSRSPEGREVFFKDIRLTWKNKVLTPTPRNLLTTGGDLNKLTKLLTQPIRRRSNGFIPNIRAYESKKYFRKTSRENSHEEQRKDGKREGRSYQAGARNPLSRSSRNAL